MSAERNDEDVRDCVRDEVRQHGISAGFDLAGAFFERETGMLPPGKDDRFGSHSYEDRSTAWLAWRKRVGV